MTIFTEGFEDKGFARYENPTGFVENYKKSLGTTIESGMSISPLIADSISQYGKQRNEQIDKLLSNGDIPAEYGDMLGDYMSYGDLAIIARDKFGLSVQSDDEVDKSIREDIKRNATEANKVFSKASGMGKVGIVAGALNAALLDPPSVIGSFIGLGAAASGATVLSRIALAAGSGAAVAVAEEATIQPFVYNWKQTVGLDYSTGDALESIGYAAVGGGILVGGAKTAGEFVSGTRKFLKSHNVSRVKDTDVVTEEAFKNIQNRVDEADTLPPETNIKEHFEGVDTFIRDRDTAAPTSKMEVDVEDTADAIVDGTFKAEVENLGKVEGETLHPWELSKPEAKQLEQPKAEEMVYAKELVDEGAGKKSVVVGDAIAEVEGISKQMKALEAIDKCLHG